MDNPLIFGGEDHGSPSRRWSNVWEGGWPILHALHARLSALDPGYRVRSVRERDGGLSVDVEVAVGAVGEADAAVGEAARAAAATCEICGAAAELRTEPPGRWVKTLCDAHAAPDEVDRWTAVSGGRAGGRS